MIIYKQVIYTNSMRYRITSDYLEIPLDYKKFKTTSVDYYCDDEEFGHYFIETKCNLKSKELLQSLFDSNFPEDFVNTSNDSSHVSEQWKGDHDEGLAIEIWLDFVKTELPLLLFEFNEL